MCSSRKKHTIKIFPFPPTKTTHHFNAVNRRYKQCLHIISYIPWCTSRKRHSLPKIGCIIETKGQQIKDQNKRSQKMEKEMRRWEGEIRHFTNFSHPKAFQFRSQGSKSEYRKVHEAVILAGSSPSWGCPWLVGRWRKKVIYARTMHIVLWYCRLPPASSSDRPAPFLVDHVTSSSDLSSRTVFMSVCCQVLNAQLLPLEGLLTCLSRSG